MDQLKKIKSLLWFAFYFFVATSLIASLAAASSFTAEGYNCNLAEKASISGVFKVYVSGKADDNFTLKVDGQTVYPDEKSKHEILFFYKGGDGLDGRDIKTDSASNAANKVILNGKLIGRLPSDGSIGVGLRASKCKDGENTVAVLIGGFYGDGVYNERKPHGQGTGNQGKTKDDFLLSNIRFVLPDGRVVTPDGFVSYKAKAVGSTEKVVTRYEPYPFKKDEMFWVGDGWGSYDTWAGNTTDQTIINSVDKGRFDIPYKVEFLLNYQRLDSEAIFVLDTSTFKDGLHTMEIFASDTCVWRKELIIDNSLPIVTTNLVNQQNVENGFILEATFTDEVSGIKTHLTRLEGKEISNDKKVRYQLTDLEPGVHSLIFEASDNAGNTIYQSLYFNIIEKAAPIYKMFASNDGSFSLMVEGNESYEVAFYEADLLEYASYSGIFDGFCLSKSKQAFSLADPVFAVTTRTTSTMPYHAFDVDVNNVNAEKVNLSYQGSTLEGERIALKVFNPQTSNWDTLATGIGKVNLLAEVDLENYAQNGIIRVIAITDYITNGSNILLWVTDPQYYTEFQDLNEFYYKIYQYAASEYLKGNVGYLINTGDLVNNSPSSPLAKHQWEIANKALNYAESIGVPSGVVTGNHDTGNFPSVDYSLFGEYFGADRYRNKPYYGGGLNNNACHYDLVTIDNNDLLVLYLGYGVEGTSKTIAWANQILQCYRHRNAIICTHQYLSASGIYDQNSRAKEIFSEIVVPNENVKMLLCGHNNGSDKVKREIGGRLFYEILSDYQFVQLKPLSYYNNNKHYQGSIPYCNGEGYIRSMTFEGDRIKTKTFSPVTGGKNPFGNRDEFEIIVDFKAPKRQLTTYDFNATVIGNEIDRAIINEGKTYQSKYPGSAKVLVAAISTVSGVVITEPIYFTIPKTKDIETVLTLDSKF